MGEGQGNMGTEQSAGHPAWHHMLPLISTLVQAHGMSWRLRHGHRSSIKNLYPCTLGLPTCVQVEVAISAWPLANLANSIPTHGAGINCSQRQLCTVVTRACLQQVFNLHARTLHTSSALVDEGVYPHCPGMLLLIASEGKLHQHLQQY